MNDVDYARIRRAWQSVRAGPARLAAFTDTVLRRAPPPARTPPGARDLPAPRRPARPARRPGPHRHAPPTTSATRYALPRRRRRPGARRCSAPRCSPSGRPARARRRQLVRPVAESLCLQALAGQAAVVAVGGRRAPARPRRGVRRRRPDRRPGAPSTTSTSTAAPTDPDEAAAMLAEALVGDLATRPAATAAARPPPSPSSSAPSVPPTAASPPCPSCASCWTARRRALARAARRRWRTPGTPRMLRELDARERQTGRPGDVGPACSPTGSRCSTGPRSPGSSTRARPAARPFSLRALRTPAAGPHRPARARPRRGVPDAGPAACSPSSPRRRRARGPLPLRLPGPRRRHAARSPRGVRGSSGCAPRTPGVRARAAHPGRRAGGAARRRCSARSAAGWRSPGVTTWDGKRFAEAWGTEWVETRDVTNRHTVSPTSRSPAPCTPCAGWSPARPSPPSR